MPWYIIVIAGLVGAIIGLEIYHKFSENGGLTFIVKPEENAEEERYARAMEEMLNEVSKAVGLPKELVSGPGKRR